MEVLNDLLKQAGLNEVESCVYTTLLENGALTVLELSNKADLKRTNLYNILLTLEEKGLIKKVVNSKSIKYVPQSPREIQKLLELKEDQISLAKNTFEIIANSLQSKYNIVSHKPVISYMEGLTGVQKVYQDILDTKKDILLLRSTYDDKRADIDRLVQKQLVAQVKHGIHARVVGPPEKDAKELYLKYDSIRMVEERFITRFPFNLPAQIIIYGNKTAIITIREDIIITLIDNEEITQTFKTLFDFVWQYATPEHEELVKNWAA